MGGRSEVRELFRQQRGSSAIIGLVILFGVVAIGSVGLLIVGSNGVDSVEQDIQKSAAEKEMDQLRSEVIDTTVRGNTPDTVQLSHGDTAAMPSASRFVVRDESGTKLYEHQQGRIVHETGNQQLIFEAGAVIRSSPGTNNGVLLSPPPAHYTGKTLNFPTYAIDDNDLVNGNEVQFTTGHSKSVSTAVAPGKAVFLEFHTQYYEVLGEYFENEIGSDQVTVDHDTEHVEVEFETEGGLWGLDYAIVGSTVDIDGGKINYGVYADGDVDMEDSGIDGNLFGAVVDIDETDVTGDVRSEDDLTVDSGSIGGAAHSLNGSVDLEDAAVGGDVRGESAVDLDGGSVDGDVHAHDDVTLDQNEIDGNLHATGDTTVENQDINQEVHVTGDLDIEEGDVGGDMYVEGETTLDEVTVDGDAHIEGDTGLDEVTIDGDLYVSLDHPSDELDCEDTTVNGTVYTDDAADVTGCGSVVENGNLSVEDPSSPEAPIEPPEEPSIDTDIPDKPTSNDNSKIGGDKINLDDEDLTIESGDYVLEELTVDDGTLEFNTSNGPINIWYEGNGNDDISLDGDESTVYDDGTGNGVNIYTVGSSSVEFSVDDTPIQTNANGNRADLFNLYLENQQSVDIDDEEQFTGEIYAPETNHEIDAEAPVAGIIYAPNGEVTSNVDSEYAVKVPDDDLFNGASADEIDHVNINVHGVSGK